MVASQVRVVSIDTSLVLPVSIETILLSCVVQDREHAITQLPIRSGEVLFYSPLSVWIRVVEVTYPRACTSSEASTFSRHLSPWMFVVEKTRR